MAKGKSSSKRGAGAQKIKAGPSGKMYGAQTVSAQKPGVSATTQTRSRKSYAK